MFQTASQRLFPKLSVLSCALLVLAAAARAENGQYGAEPEYSIESVVSAQTQKYLIGPEDVLEISVWKNAELSKEVIVRPDGMISLPLIGDVRAAGRTPAELRRAIIERLKEYQETVVASVIVKSVNSYKIFILGEVMKPGMYELKKRTTLLQAIAVAGGFNQFASKNKIVVIRERIEGGREQKINVRFDDIVYKDDDNTKNLVLMPGDTIFVP